MTVKELSPKLSLNKAYLKIKPNRTEIELFKSNLITLLDKLKTVEDRPKDESEEHLKTDIRDFLRDTFYKDKNAINTKDRSDLVIHESKDTNSNVAVIIEAKRPSNKNEMLSKDNLNKKALQELVLYYLNERITHKNLRVKNLVVTNINEWYIFDENLFERLFTKNKSFVKQFEDFKLGKKTTSVFYKEIAEPYIQSVYSQLEYTYFNLSDYQDILKNTDKQDDNELISLFKLLSPPHLLQLPFNNDSNSLDKNFYSEFLHVIGLVETKEGSKKIIGRLQEKNRLAGSLMENTINQLDSLDKLSRLTNINQYGNTHEERLFNVSLELCITWINRILFLKLLEAQLISYHKGNKVYSFLNSEKVKDYDNLNSLFFMVMARKPEERNDRVKELFDKVPYLSSSLFEPTLLEHDTLFISGLEDNIPLPFLSNTVIKDIHGNKEKGNRSAINYLFDFLSSYDFTSEGSSEIQEDNRTLINASVLGLIFEKINGYKDGSYFTPGFITMYMCRETIRKAVIQKFNDVKNWNCQNWEELYDNIEFNTVDGRNEANSIINSIKICDPAVGSGHFLVSALNEMIAVKNDLKVLQDKSGKRLKEIKVEVINDDLIISDQEDGDLFTYTPANDDSQRIQETFFHEKETIIENCLFGVDVNPNSVKICRLRLWIELLKNAYYTAENVLETLPNIDINIKCGNSLVSRFPVDTDLTEIIKKSKWTVDEYKKAVDTYRNAESKDQKREMEQLIKDIKSDFRSEITKNDPKVKRLYNLNGEITKLTTQHSLFEPDKKEKTLVDKQVQKLMEESNKIKLEIEEIKSNKIYENAFEWRFEFPEVLNNEGDFIGFDVIIGNPPYFLEENPDLKNFYKINYRTLHFKINLFSCFIERGFTLSRKKAQFSFIIPNLFFANDSVKLTRKFFLEKSTPTFFMNLGDNVFEGATVPTMIFSTCYLSSINCDVKIYPKVNNIEDIKHSFFKISKSSFLSNFNFVIETANPEVSILLKQIEENSDKIESHLDINQGIITGNDEKLISSIKHDDLWIKTIRGKDISKYHSTEPQLYVKYSVKELACPRTKDIFEVEKKLLMRRTGDSPVVAIDDKKLYNLHTLYSIRTKNSTPVEFYLALLNSSLIKFIYQQKLGTEIGRTFAEIKILYIRQLPIPKLTINIESIVDKVKKVMNLKSLNLPSHEIESEIDAEIFKLYNLSFDQIKIILKN